MKLKTKNLNYLQLIYIFLLIVLILILVVFPRYSVDSFYTGIVIWGKKILPTLLPFFIATKLLSYTSFIPYLEKKISPITGKLYRTSGISGYIYIMSVISGYPVGAKLTSDLFLSGKLSRGQAITITAFTSTSGPLFILGTVALGLFNSSKMGYIILFSHFLGATVNGLLYRNKEENIIDTLSATSTKNILNDTMTSSIFSILNIGGFIALFYMLISLMINLNIFAPILFVLNKLRLNTDICEAILSGLIEVTTGEIMLSKLSLSFRSSTIISTALISFGGLSIHAQAYSYLSSFGMSYGKFLLQKTTQTIISILISSIVLCFI